MTIFAKVIKAFGRAGAFRSRIMPCGLLASVIGFQGSAFSAGSGLNVLVVVNQNSTNSVRLGNAYSQMRGVPPNNYFRMSGWSGSTQTWSLDDFETHLRSPLLQHITRYNLSNQIHYVLLSMDIPYRVRSQTHENSTTSVLFYGFKTNGSVSQPGLPESCSRPPDAVSSYAFSESPWPEAASANPSGPAFLAMMVTGRSYNQALATLVRGTAADGTRPSSPVWLAKTTDAARNVRYLDFDNALFEARVWGDSSIVVTNSDSTSTLGLRGLSTGLFGFSFPAGAFVPGALADSLTSFSGALFEQHPGTILYFLEGGAAATYGTVVEPCNVPEKFPNPLVYYYQDRGFSAAEAYYLSVGMPFQGILLGEPLSAPFARPGSAGQVTRPGGLPLSDGTVLTGAVGLNFAFNGPDHGTPLQHADLFVDGVLFTNLIELPPQPGNVVTVRIDDAAVQYVVPANATLRTLALGLAEALNTQTNATGVEAKAQGDRVLLRSMVPGVLGLSPSLNVTVSQGAATRTTTFARAAQPVFVASPAAGFFGMAASNTPAAGDWLRLSFVLTNGQQVVVAATNTASSASMPDLVGQLIAKVNATPELHGPGGLVAGDLYPYAQDRAAYFAVQARSPGWQAAQIQIDFDGAPGVLILAEGDRLIDNRTDLVPRNHIYLSAGAIALAPSCTLDTRSLADGWHEVTSVAYEGTSVRTQTRVTRNIRIQNTPLEAGFHFNGDALSASIALPAEFELTANTNTISRMDLFGTGGLLHSVTNQANAIFTVDPAKLGLGLHPFYAVVTRQDGAQYRTAVVHVNFVHVPALNISGPPWLLTWNAEPGRKYQVLGSANLSSFQLLDVVTTTNLTGQWLAAPAPGTPAMFYRLNLEL